MRGFHWVIAALMWIGVEQAAAAPSAAGRLEFEVTRNGTPFGRHVVVVTGGGEDFQVSSDVNLRVRLGPITAFRLEQTCSETWRDGALAALRCSTLKDGRRVEIHGAQEADALMVRIGRSPGEIERYALDAIPTSWWTRPPVGIDTMLNTETGKPMPVRVTRMGTEQIEVGGGRIEAERIRVVGTLVMDLWYDEQGRWVGCAFTARGQRVQYRLASPRSAAPA